MTDLAFAGHTNHADPWTRGELARVLAKLTDQGQLSRLHVALEPGVPLDATEAALLQGIPVTLHPLHVGAELFARYQGHPGMEERLRAVCRHRLLDIVDPPAGGINRAHRKRRSVLLADHFATHLVVYDGRDRGSVLDHLQYVMGTHDVIVIDPTDQVTRRIVPQGASTCLTPISSTATPSP